MLRWLEEAFFFVLATWDAWVCFILFCGVAGLILWAAVL
jgi:hypothetical protein